MAMTTALMKLLSENDHGKTRTEAGVKQYIAVPAAKPQIEFEL